MQGRAAAPARHAVVIGTGRESFAAARSLLDSGAAVRISLVDDVLPRRRDEHPPETAGGPPVLADHRVRSVFGRVTGIRCRRDGTFGATVTTGAGDTDLTGSVLAVESSRGRSSFWEHWLRDAGLCTVSGPATALVPDRCSVAVGGSTFVVDRFGQSSVDNLFILGGRAGGPDGIGGAFTAAGRAQTPRDRMIYDLIWSRDVGNPPDQEVVDLLESAAADRPAGEPLRVVDLGCGRGRHALFAAGIGAEVVAVDHSSRAVAQLNAAAETAGLRVRAVEGDLVEWARAHRGSADVVLCVCAAHHLTPDPAELRRVLGDVAAVAAPGGRVLVALLTDISYGDLEWPPGRTLLSEKDGWELLGTAMEDLPRLWRRRSPGRIDDVLLYDDERREIVVSFYRATRLTVAHRRAVPA